MPLPFKKYKRKFIIGILPLLTSCAAYQTHVSDVPLLSEKGEARVDLAVSLQPGANATVSYAATEKLALQTFGSIGDNKQFYIQGAAGIFSNSTINRVWEIYGGVGHGYGVAYRDANSYIPNNFYQLYFTQFNYGRIADENSNLELGFGFKGGFLNMHLDDISENLSIQPGNNNLLFEPIGFVRFGSSNLRVNLKLGISSIYNLDKDVSTPLNNYFNIGLGINYKL